MHLLKRVILLAVTLTFGLVLLVRISDSKPDQYPDQYVHPATRNARAVHWGRNESSGIQDLEDKLTAANTTWLKHNYVRQVCSPWSTLL